MNNFKVGQYYKTHNGNRKKWMVYRVKKIRDEMFARKLIKTIYYEIISNESTVMGSVSQKFTVNSSRDEWSSPIFAYGTTLWKVMND